jgi:homoserine kinase
MFVVADKLETAQQIELLLKKYYLQNDEGFTHICKIDTQGTRVI